MQGALEHSPVRHHRVVRRHSDWTLKEHEVVVTGQTWMKLKSGSHTGRSMRLRASPANVISESKYTSGRRRKMRCFENASGRMFLANRSPRNSG